MYQEFIDDANHRMDSAIRSLDEDLAAFRTGRASPRLLDRVVIEMYDMEMSLKQMAVISISEPQQLMVRPFDEKTISVIERALIKADLGMMPNSDGKVIRLNLPRLTEERRRELSKQVGRRVEEAKIAVRNVRRDCLHDIKELKDDKIISEDDLEVAQELMKKLTDRHTDKIEEMGKHKVAEIMEV